MGCNQKAVETAPFVRVKLGCGVHRELWERLTGETVNETLGAQTNPGLDFDETVADRTLRLSAFDRTQLF